MLLICCSDLLEDGIFGLSNLLMKTVLVFCFGFYHFSLSSPFCGAELLFVPYPYGLFLKCTSVSFVMGLRAHMMKFECCANTWI